MNSVPTQLILVLTSMLLLVVPGVEAVEAGDAIALLLGVVLSITGICACLGIYARKRNGQIWLWRTAELDFTLTTLKTIVLLRPDPRFDLSCSQQEEDGFTLLGVSHKMGVEGVGWEWGLFTTKSALITWPVICNCCLGRGSKRAYICLSIISYFLNC